MRSILRCGLLLASPVLSTGCSRSRAGTAKRVAIRGLFSAIMAVSIATTLSGCATQGIVFATSENLCQDWRAISVSKHDKITEQTASEIEANNKSRPAWGCIKNG